MKKIICITLSLLILFSAAGCGGATKKTADKADIDLTKMSSTMVFAEVYNMMTLPENYVGKTVKMKGNVSVYRSDDGNTYSCMIADAAQCCRQGISFTLLDGYTYPPEGTEITITGIFDLEAEEDYQYGTIKNARLI